MGNSAISKVIGKEQSSFGLMIDGSLLFMAFVMFRIKVQSHLSWSLHREGFCFSSKGDLVKVSK